MRFAKYLTLFVLLLAQPVSANCGFCAREVTLSENLAACFLDRVEDELARVRELQLDVHLVELAACGATRGGNPMPELKQGEGSSSSVQLDESFLIPAAAINCLAKAMRQADFDPEKVQTFEVREDCED